MLIVGTCERPQVPRLQPIGSCQIPTVPNRSVHGDDYKSRHKSRGIDTTGLDSLTAAIRAANLVTHFNWSNEINVVVKVLLSCIHEGHLWLDHRVDTTIDLIHQIIGLSKNGADPMTHFMGKDHDKKLTTWLIKKYKLTRGGRAYDAAQIEDKPLRFMV